MGREASARRQEGIADPPPQPERTERRLRDPGLKDLSRRDYWAALKRAVKEAKDDQITDLAAALAYYSFLAIPSVLLVAVGVFSLVADATAINRLMDRFSDVVPAETTQLLGQSLTTLSNKPGQGIVMTAVGFVLALWSTTGAMTAFMRALNRAYDRDETRGFVRQRLVAVVMVAVMAIAFLLVFGLLVLGPQLTRLIESQVSPLAGVIGWVWWIAQWPILLVGLLGAFATLLYLGPDVDHPRWRFLTGGTLVAVLVWLGVSGAFAVYTAMFGSYNKTWGSLAAVIVMLTWLWLTGIALLLGAEINAELERSRELRSGQPAERRLQAPAKGS